MGLLEGMVVFVTGAARGQGRAHAVASAREGADVVLLDLADQISTVAYPMATKEDLADTVRAVEGLGRRAISVVGDVRAQSDVDAAVAQGIEAFGRVDAVIANAGIVSVAPFWEITEQGWNDTVDTNLSGVWRTAKAVAPHMIEAGSGSIIVISSVNGLEAGDGTAAYAAAKHGLIGLMKTIAVELGPHGVRCNAICPGAIHTGMVDNVPVRDRIVGHEGATIDELIEGVRHYGVLRGSTMLSPDAIARAAVFLNSQMASDITGVALPVDAGHLLLPGFNHAPVR
jgi:SDR family mycofactocin-dependent oxidoreductase